MQDVATVKRGDIVDFKSYSLRVDSDPETERGGTRLRGRVSVGGCEWVSRWYMRGTQVSVRPA